MNFGGPKSTTQTTTTQLSPEQKKLIDLALPGLEQFAANPPQLPSFSGVAGFDPSQVAGQEAALAAAPGQGALATGGADATNFLFQDALFPDTNPALQATIDASVRPIFEGLTESALPAIRNEAVSTGNFGSSRQGIAEGIASREASRAAGDTAAGVATAGFNSGLDALTKALGVLPQTIQSQTAPAVTTSGVGDVRQGQAQAGLNEDTSRFNFEQLLPLLTGKELAGIAGGLPGGGAKTVGSAPEQKPFNTALGLASLGTSLFAPASGVGFLSQFL